MSQTVIDAWRSDGLLEKFVDETSTVLPDDKDDYISGVIQYGKRLGARMSLSCHLSTNASQRHQVLRIVSIGSALCSPDPRSKIWAQKIGLATEQWLGQLSPTDLGWSWTAATTRSSAAPCSTTSFPARK
jgi:hypothetical protein